MTGPVCKTWTNPFDPIDGVNNDGNGYEDDVRGWDFDPQRQQHLRWHAGRPRHACRRHVGAAGGNGKGIAGVCWSVKLISAKFLGRAGGITANAIKALDYITDLKTGHGLNIVATNNSWGGGGYSQSLKDAIERANAADILFIAAARNGGSDGVGATTTRRPITLRVMRTPTSLRSLPLRAVGPNRVSRTTVPPRSTSAPRAPASIRRSPAKTTPRSTGPTVAPPMVSCW